ncbi:MAG: hypothetical protein AABX32_06625 [Nanoarchaeota archaeon]
MVYLISQLQAVSYGSAAFVIMVLIMIFFNSRMNDIIKKMVYSLLVAVVSVVTLYLAITTILPGTY